MLYGRLGVLLLFLTACGVFAWTDHMVAAVLLLGLSAMLLVILSPK